MGTDRHLPAEELTEELTFDKGKIGFIGIEHIGELKSYDLTRKADQIVHLIEFDDGGTCEIRYRITVASSLQLENLTARKVGMTFKSDRIVLHKFRGHR